MPKPVEILVRDASYPDEIPPFQTREDVISAIREELAELSQPESFEDVNIGHRAGFPFLAVSLLGLSTAVALFLQGKKIEENLDAWIRLAKRFRAAVGRLTGRVGTVYVDEAGISWSLLTTSRGRMGPCPRWSPWTHLLSDLTQIPGIAPAA